MVAYVYPWGVIVSLTEGCICLWSLFACWTADNDMIGDEGVFGIAKGLDKNTSLNEIDLGCMFSAHLVFIHCCISSSHSFLCLLFAVRDELCHSPLCD
jgi:hypothetical protein